MHTFVKWHLEPCGYEYERPHLTTMYRFICEHFLKGETYLSPSSKTNDSSWDCRVELNAVSMLYKFRFFPFCTILIF